MPHVRGILSTPNRVLIAQLWVSSVAGSGLVFILQAFGTDWRQWQFGCWDWPFMIDRALRYALAFWFAAHLTIQYVLGDTSNAEEPTSLVSDISQSILGFIALGSLGFVTQKFTIDSVAPEEFAVPFVSIACIGGLTWLTHRQSRDRCQRIRASAWWIGVVFVPIIYYFGPRSVGTDWDYRWIIVLAATLLSWVALARYWYVRNKSPSNTHTNATSLTTTDVSSMINGGGI